MMYICIVWFIFALLSGIKDGQSVQNSVCACVCVCVCVWLGINVIKLIFMQIQ